MTRHIDSIYIACLIQLTGHTFDSEWEHDFAVGSAMKSMFLPCHAANALSARSFIANIAQIE